MPRALLVVVTGCLVVAASSFLAVYAVIGALTDDTWPDL